MSVLGRRLAATESAYFLQESKNAVGRLAVKNKNESGGNKPSVGGAPAENLADVLPEVLRHSIPLLPEQDALPSSLAGGCKWTVSNDSSAAFPRHGGAVNPLRDYVSLPPVTLGPKRWQLPEGESSTLPSTANELRRERYHRPIDSENLKAATAGIAQIGKAFAVATALVFGGAATFFALTASKLQIQSTDDVRERGRDLIHPTAEIFQSRMAPLRTWVEKKAGKWEGVKVNGEESQLLKKLSETLGRREG